MSNYIDKVLDHKKYNLMGVNPRELYLRQIKKCWLELIPVEDVKDGGPKYMVQCTDGEEWAETDKMINPTFECVRCLTTFALKIKESNEH